MPKESDGAPISESLAKGEDDVGGEIGEQLGNGTAQGSSDKELDSDSKTVKAKNPFSSIPQDGKQFRLGGNVSSDVGVNNT